MSLYQFTDDEAWLGNAPPPTIDIPLQQVLEAALVNQRTWSSSENATDALHTLCDLGLVVQVDTSGAGSNQLAQHIVQDLLNYTIIHHQPRHHGFLIQVHGNAQAIEIPVRSKLLLYRISMRLSVDIFVFSSRTKPFVVRGQGVAGAIGLFHRVDSVMQAGEYLVLGASNPLATITRPAPQPALPHPPYQTKAAVYRAGDRVKSRLFSKLPQITKAKKLQIFREAW